jgi:hypothetical protein
MEYNYVACGGLFDSMFIHVSICEICISVVYSIHCEGYMLVLGKVNVFLMLGKITASYTVP